MVMAQVARVLRIGSPPRSRQAGVAAVKNSRRPVIPARLGLVTAAQFLTLRLIPIGSTHMGCDDSDGPGHAPRYLYVRRN